MARWPDRRAVRLMEARAPEGRALDVSSSDIPATEARAMLPRRANGGTRRAPRLAGRRGDLEGEIRSRTCRARPGGHAARLVAARGWGAGGADMTRGPGPRGTRARICSLLSRSYLRAKASTALSCGAVV